MAKIVTGKALNNLLIFLSAVIIAVSVVSLILMQRQIEVLKKRKAALIQEIEEKQLRIETLKAMRLSITDEGTIFDVPCPTRRISKDEYLFIIGDDQATPTKPENSKSKEAEAWHEASAN